MEKQWYNALLFLKGLKIKENPENLINSNNTRIYLDVLQNKLGFTALFGGWLEHVRNVFCNLSIDAVVHSVVNLLMYCSGVGWPWLDTSCPPKMLYHSTLQLYKGEKLQRSLMGWGRAWERSFSNYHYKQNRLDLGKWV